jgi:hypothetical protein
MQTTFEISPEEWTEGFWKWIMPLFGQRKVRVTVEEIDGRGQENQYEVYLRMKGLEEKYPPVKIDGKIDLSRLADDSNDAVIYCGKALQ